MQTLIPEETSARGRAYYAQYLRAIVEPEHIGKFSVLDVETGDYEVDADEVAAVDRAVAKHPSANRYIMRVDYRAARRIGGSLASIKST